MAGLIEATGLAIERERALGVAPPGPDAQDLATQLVWQGERMLFLALIDTGTGAPRESLGQSGTSIWLRAIYVSDDPKASAAEQPGGKRSAADSKASK